MPTLDWIGKNKVINHHLDVPFKVLEKQYTYKDGKVVDDFESENKIIHGDNLEALKALLPEYEGKFNCICIDPPYNTGNEKWKYNDNVNDPKIKKWLGEVVGKEEEDFTRHDKWLCMMYPRLRLLHKLLNEKGIICINIDENEVYNLDIICSEIFGHDNKIGEFIWKARGGKGGTDSNIAQQHEYILCYAKDKHIVEFRKIENQVSEDKKEHLRQWGQEVYRTDRPSMFFPIFYDNEGFLLPEKEEVKKIFVDEKFDDDFLKELIESYKKLGYECILPKINGEYGRWRKGFDGIQELISDGLLLVEEKDGEKYIKKIIPADSVSEMAQDSILPAEVGTASNGTVEIKNIFLSKVFDTTKPCKLLEYLINLCPNTDALILDSFAGTGTTAHAVIKLNKQDGGNRKFVLIEMMDYAESITSERIKRVINGYGVGKKTVKGINADFSYYELGPRLLLENGFINEDVSIDKIREYIWFTETHSKITVNKNESEYFLGNNYGVAYWFYYQKDKATILDTDFLNTIKGKYEQYIIYADICLLPKDFMQKNNIIFKKIPRDIHKF